MLVGELTTMPLPDLLQWLDASQIDGRLELQVPGCPLAGLSISDRSVVAISPPRVEGRLAEGTPDERRALATEYLLDVFLVDTGGFRFTRTTESFEGDLPADHALRFIVLEGLRIRDEWARVSNASPGTLTCERSRGAAAPTNPLRRAVLDCLELGLSLTRIERELGISRPTLMRSIDDLQRAGELTVNGKAQERDASRDIIQQAMVMLKEHQFAEANHVLRTLLIQRPNDAALRHLLREAERMEIAAHYESMPPAAFVSPVDRSEGNRARDGGSGRGTCSGAELEILSALGGGAQTTTLVLSSPLPELDTLRALSRLVRRGYVQVS